MFHIILKPPLIYLYNYNNRAAAQLLLANNSSQRRRIPCHHNYNNRAAAQLLANNSSQRRRVPCHHNYNNRAVAQLLANNSSQRRRVPCHHMSLFPPFFNISLPVYDCSKYHRNIDTFLAINNYITRGMKFFVQVLFTVFVTSSYISFFHFCSFS